MAYSSNDGRPRILICGYYGEHNLGDDALLSVLLNQLDDGWSPVITARDRQAVESIAPGLETVNRRSLASVLKAVRHVDALILGGGSLLQDSTSTRSLIYYILLIWCAKSLQKPVLLWGQGLGPLKRSINRLLVRLSLKTISSVTWRDPSSMTQAKEWKLEVPMNIGPDPVWGHSAPPWTSGQSLILCWRPTPLLGRSGWHQLVSSLSRFSEIHDLNVIWLAFHEHQDASLFQSLVNEQIVSQSLEQRSTTLVAESISQVQKLFSESRMIIAMRLHALILAAVGGVPTSALSYDPKVAAAAELAGIPYSVLNNQLSEQHLIAQWNEAMKKPLAEDEICALARDAKIHSDVLNKNLRQLIRR